MLRIFMLKLQSGRGKRRPIIGHYCQMHKLAGTDFRVGDFQRMQSGYSYKYYPACHRRCYGATGILPQFPAERFRSIEQ